VVDVGIAVLEVAPVVVVVADVIGVVAVAVVVIVVVVVVIVVEVVVVVVVVVVVGNGRKNDASISKMYDSTVSKAIKPVSIASLKASTSAAVASSTPI